MKKQNVVDFDCNDFNLIRVIMDVASSNQKNLLQYHLLVDESANVILDYQIIFKKLFITPTLTASQQAHQSDLHQARREILNILNLKENYTTTISRKKYFIIDDHQLLEKVSNYFNNCWSYKISFQNIEKLIRGSNPSGQGNGYGFLNTQFNGKSIPFGFLLQDLNYSKKFHNKYSKIPNNLFEYAKKTISFEQWINNDVKICKCLNRYINEPWSWKLIKQDIQKVNKSTCSKYDQINTSIIRERNNGKKLFSKKYNEKKFNHLYKMFFPASNQSIKYEVAHIFPVWYIKKLIMNDSSSSIKFLSYISDINNLIPLTPNMHKAYDNYLFYWSYDSGKIVIKDYDLMPLDYNDFSKLNIDGSRKKYLQLYYQKIWKIEGKPKR